MTGTVVWSRDVDFENEGRISFRLKSKDDLSYVVMVFKLTWATHYYPLDLGDLRNLQGALRATRTQLEAARLDALIREKEAEKMRLGGLEKIWRWAADTPLWREDLFLNSGGKISLRIGRSPESRFEIAFKSGDEFIQMPIQPRRLAYLEDAVIETRMALENARAPTRSTAV